ncbi:MAG: acyl--CoA ligase [Candidatus Marinimicrobia bacterium]|nr:acyl--CoA ligase [Candidatus Neomarinimicrobiota bacterium]
MATVETWLHQQAAAQPNASCLQVEQHHFTFKELALEVDQAAGKIQAHGWHAGPVGIWLPDGVAMILTLWAVSRTGGVVLPLHDRLQVDELLDNLARTGCSRLITTRERAAQLRGRLPDDLVVLPLKELLRSDGPRLPGVIGDAMPPRDHDLHAIVMTSGTTGQPKAVQLTYGNQRAGSDGWISFLSLSPEDHYLSALPLSHVAGMGVLLRGARAGIPVTCLPSGDAATINAQLDKGNITHVSLVPTQLQRMLIERNGQAFRSTVKAIILGGAPASPALITAALQHRAPLVLTYGMTETAAGFTALKVTDQPGKRGSVGRPFGEGQIAIVDDAGLQLPTGETGLIRVKSSAVMTGYRGQPPLRDGVYTTGDYGRLDEDGFLYLEPGRSLLIISGGENVDPLEVESALLDMPGVADVCVVGLPDEDLGQRVVAVLKAQTPGTNVDSLARLCRQRMAGYKVPRAWVIWASLPRSASGKLRRAEIRRRLLAGDAAAHQSVADSGNR